MEITKELQALAKFSDSTFPVFSVYLNTQLHASSQHDRSAAFLARYLRQAHALAVASDAARESLEHDLKRMQQWGEQHLDGRSDVDAASVALFTCRGAGLWVEFPSPLPFANQFTIADRPALTSSSVGCCQRQILLALLPSCRGKMAGLGCTTGAS